MTKQEEIREGIGKIVSDTVKLHSIRAGNQAVFVYTGDKPLQDLILEYLHSQGVVIKVDKEFPESLTVYGYGEEKYLRMVSPQELKEAGYVAVEPLIKEVKIEK